MSANIRRWPVRRLAAGVLALSALGTLTLTAAHADNPPFPDVFWAYGTVLDSGANITPEVQPILALVNGNVCGAAQTLVAPQGDTDAGRTVYTVDILAAGSSSGDAPGCGHPGDPVTFYFPATGRIAVQQPPFGGAGGTRVDLDLGIALTQHQVIPAAATDGLP